MQVNYRELSNMFNNYAAWRNVPKCANYRFEGTENQPENTRAILSYKYKNTNEYPKNTHTTSSYKYEKTPTRSPNTPA